MNSSIPFELRTPARPISNTEFLCALAPRPVNGAAYAPWVVSFAGDPSSHDLPRDVWTGYAAARKPEGWGSIPESATVNSFFTVSVFKEIEHNIRRAKGFFGGTHTIVLDDVGDGPGAKIPWSAIAHYPPPTYVLETSPGNFQLGYRLQDLLTDPIRYDRLVTGVIRSLGLEADPGMAGVTRYVRLPVGSNGKAKYGPEPFQHRLVHWNPDAAYTIEELEAGFRVDKSTQPSLKHYTAVDGESPWTELVMDVVPVLSSPRPGDLGGRLVDIECPWADEHTGGDITGTAWYLNGGFRCHHGHCQHRDQFDVQKWLMRGADRVGDEAERIRTVAYGIYGDQMFPPEVLKELDAQPPAPPLDDPAAPEGDYLSLFKRIEKEFRGKPEEVSKVRDFLVDVHRAQLSASEESAIIDELHTRSTLAKGALKDDLKDIKRQAKDARRRGQRDEAGSGTEPPGAEGAAAAANQQRLFVVLDSDIPYKSEQGAPKPVTRNVEVMMQQGGVLPRRNAMTLQIELDGDGYADWTIDDLIRALRDSFAIMDGTLSQEQAMSCVAALARQHQYHPFEDFLDGLQWDGVDRFPALAATVRVEGSKDAEEMRDVLLRRWLKSAVAAARWLYKDLPGQQPKGVLVFAGEQNIGKTGWLRALFSGLYPGSGECFREAIHLTADKDSRVTALGSLCAELGEIDSTMNKTESGILKGFLSSHVSHIRLPYAAASTAIPHRTAFAGTVNRYDFLRDETGNVRYWVITAAWFDFKAMAKIDLTQLWAQMDHECRGELAAMRAQGQVHSAPWLLDPLELTRLAAVNREHLQATDELRLLRDRFDWDNMRWREAPLFIDKLRINPMTMSDIVKACTGETLRGRNGSWHSALAFLTGQPKARKTSLYITRKDPMNPDSNIQVLTKGLLWAMPPQINLGENIFFDDD